jgi:glyoxylase-like metal-dependent hydrolase (beta-lactamase superfamily II)
MSAPIDIRIVPVTPFAQNCSLIWDKVSKRAVLVDPGGEADKLLGAIEELGLELAEIWLTHGHLDHAGAADEIRERTGVPVIGPHKDDQFWMDEIGAHWARYGHPGMGRDVVPDRYLEDGDQLSLGELNFDVVHTPGHTPGHVVIVRKDLRLAFVGDVIFQNSIGRTDFPKGDHATLIRSIKEKLLPLGDDIQFVPGHGPASTFGRERMHNPFLVEGSAPNSSGVG